MNCTGSVSLWLGHLALCVDPFPDLLKHTGHIKKPTDAGELKLALPRPGILIRWYDTLSCSINSYLGGRDGKLPDCGWSSFPLCGGQAQKHSVWMYFQVWGDNPKFLEHSSLSLIRSHQTTDVIPDVADELWTQVLWEMGGVCLWWSLHLEHRLALDMILMVFCPVYPETSWEKRFLHSVMVPQFPF